MSKYEGLDVWKEAHGLVLDIYKVTDSFPKEEKFRLTDQLCRASSSVTINICEGTGRSTQKDFVHFLYMARGSLHETSYELLLAKDLSYIDSEQYGILIEKCDKIGKMLNGLINKVGY